jgi:hypothetical protein
MLSLVVTKSNLVLCGFEVFSRRFLGFFFLDFKVVVGWAFEAGYMLCKVGEVISTFAQSIVARKTPSNLT